MPLNCGESIGAFKSNAFCCSVETGLSASDVLSTFPNPTVELVIPLIVILL